jgi:2Fe-2S iron-sulfur cluster binding domain
MTETIKFFLDGNEVEALPGETIWQVANRHGVEIPHLCYSPAPGYRPDGNCRACMVEIDGERVLAASCIRRPGPAMKVATASERAKASRRLVFELLVADQPSRAAAQNPHRDFGVGPTASGSVRAASLGTSGPNPTCRTRPWRCSSTPASTAISASVPAARSRSMT